jgi:subtilisin family serine protease
VAPDQVIVKFQEDAGSAEKSNARSDEGLAKKKNLDIIDAEVDKVRGQSIEQAVSDLNSRPEVEYAEPDHILHLTGYADEARFSDLWGLDNTGQAINNHGIGTSNVDINAKEASAVTQGEPNLVVAVIDSGVDFSHPDLQGREWVNSGETPGDGVDNDRNGYVDDVNGWDFVKKDNTVYDSGDHPHGTHVSGTIAASANGQGVVGVAPNVKIMALKFLGSTGSGYTSDAISAIGYAKRMGAKISNNSWGGGGNDPLLKNAIEAPPGMLFVAAAGNDGSNSDSTPHYPSSYDSPNILSVAAVNDQGNLASFSNYGASSVDISAPGVDVLSSVPGGSWAFWNGTSMATPYATGAAALAASVNAGLLNDPQNLKKLLMDNGKPDCATLGKTATGDMVDAYAVVQAAGGSPPPNPAPCASSSPPQAAAPSSSPPQAAAPSPSPPPAAVPSPSPPPTAAPPGGGKHKHKKRHHGRRH